MDLNISINITVTNIDIKVGIPHNNLTQEMDGQSEIIIRDQDKTNITVEMGNKEVRLT